MSKVYADKIEPRDSSMDVTIGTSTNTVTLAGNDLRANTVKDSGGNTLWTSDGSGNLSNVNSALAGNLVLLSTQTASGASSVSFTSDIDDTYDVYIFKFISIHPSANNASFTFNGSSDSGSNYNVTKTTTLFDSQHNESGANNALAYDYTRDLAQSTGFQILNYKVDGASNDGTTSGSLYLFTPSSTTYVKHFYSTSQYMYYDVSSTYSINSYCGGYFNTTSAVDAIRFQMDSGNIDDGTIKMYGLL